MVTVTVPPDKSPEKTQALIANVPSARLIAQYFSGDEILQFCCCEPPTDQCCSSSGCRNVRILNRRDVETFLSRARSSKNASSLQKSNTAADSESEKTTASADQPIISSSPLINIRTPDWSFQTLLKSGDLAEAASLALALSDWRNFVFLACTSYLLYAKPAEYPNKSDQAVDSCQRVAKNRLRRILKSMFHQLVSHCLNFKATSDPRLHQKQNSCHAHRDSVLEAEPSPSSSSEDTSDVCWGPVDSSLQRQARLGTLLHSSHGHRFVTRVAAMFGFDLVTHGFEIMFGRVQNAVQRLDFLVPDGLHLPLPPLFASGRHLNMVIIVGGKDAESAREVCTRKKISYLCQKILAHLDQANCLAPSLLPLVHLSTQIQSADCSQQADIGAILQTGSKIGVHSSPYKKRPNGEDIDGHEEEMGLITDCFDKLTSLLWFLSTRDRLSAAWRRYKRWKVSVTVANSRWQRGDCDMESTLAITEESVKSVTGELLESCSQYLRALDLTSLSETNPGVHQWWEQDCRQIFTDTCSDWLSSGRPLESLKSVSPGFAKLVLCRPAESRPGWVKAWLGRNADYRKAIEGYIGYSTPNKRRARKQQRGLVNSDYLRFLSLFVEMAMVDIKQWSQQSINGPSRGGDHDASGSFEDDVPHLPCFAKELRQNAAARVDLTGVIGGNILAESDPKSSNVTANIQQTSQMFGKKGVKLILWLHSWAQGPTAFCKCMMPLKIDPTFEGLVKLKLSLPVEVLLEAIVAHPMISAIKRNPPSKQKRVSDTPLEGPVKQGSQKEEELQGQAGPNKYKVAKNENRVESADSGSESTDGSCRTFISKKLPEYYFRESSAVHEEQSNGANGLPGSSGAGGKLQHGEGWNGDLVSTHQCQTKTLPASAMSSKLEGRLVLPADSHDQKAAYHSGKVGHSTPQMKPSLSKTGQQAAFGAQPIRRIRRQAPPIPNASEMPASLSPHSNNGASHLTYTIVSSDQQQQPPCLIASENHQKKAIHDEAVVVGADFDRDIMIKFLASRGQQTTDSSHDADDDEREDVSSFDRYYPDVNNSSNRVCLDASSPRNKKLSPADSDDTLKDFTLPSSSSVISGKSGSCHQDERDKHDDVKSDHQMQGKRKSSNTNDRSRSSVSSLIKKIFKLRMNSTHFSHDSQQARLPAAKTRSEGEEIIQTETSVIPSNNTYQKIVFQPPKLLTLEATSDVDEESSALSKISGINVGRRQLKVLCAQTFIVQRVLQKIGDSLTLAQQICSERKFPSVCPLNSNKASKYVSVQMLTLPAWNTAISSDEDSSASHEEKQKEPGTKLNIGQKKMESSQQQLRSEVPKDEAKKLPKTLAAAARTTNPQDKCVATVADAGSQTKRPQEVDECVQVDLVGRLQESHDQELLAATGFAQVRPTPVWEIRQRSNRDAEVQAEDIGTPAPSAESGVSATVNGLLKKLIRRRRRANRSRHVSVTLVQQNQQLPDEESRISFPAADSGDVQCDGNNFSPELPTHHDDERTYVQGRQMLDAAAEPETDKIPSQHDDDTSLQQPQLTISKGLDGILKTPIKVNEGGMSSSPVISVGKRVTFESSEGRPSTGGGFAADQALSQHDNNGSEFDVESQTAVVNADVIASSRTAHGLEGQSHAGQGIARSQSQPNDLWNAILDAEQAAFKISNDLRSSQVLLTAIEDLADRVNA